MAVSGTRDRAERDVTGRGSVAPRFAVAVLSRPVRLAFLGLSVVALLGTATALSLPVWVRFLPLALSIVLFGLPHGAVDHLVPARLGSDTGEPSEKSVRLSAAVVGVIYLLFGGGYALVWLQAPQIAALAFIGMTWLHWGQGDVWVLVRLFDAPHLRSRTLRGATLVVRGGLPMVVPLLAYPDRYRAVVSAWVALFGVPLELLWLFAPQTRALVGAGFALVTIATVTAGRLTVGDNPDGRWAWRVDAAEVGVLWAYFALVPPLVAVGLYFTCWHSLRHIARLFLLDPECEVPVLSPDRAGWLRHTVRRFAREAAPLTALSLVLLVGFGAVVPATVRTLPEYAALYLVFVSVVTLPHVVVVGAMDYVEGIWEEEMAANAEGTR